MYDTHSHIMITTGLDTQVWKHSCRHNVEEKLHTYHLLTGWFSLSFYFFSLSHLNPLCICSWNISGSQGQAHSSTHSCAIPDNHSPPSLPPISLWLPKRPERSERRAVQAVWAMFCGDLAAQPDQ